MDGKRKDPDGFPVHQDGLPIHLDEAGIRMDFASVQGVGVFVQFIPEQSVLIPERNGVFPERNVLLSERNVLLPERNVLLPERNGVVPERNGLLSERNGLLPGGKKAGRLPLMQWRQFNLNGRFRPDGGCLFLASPRKRHEKEGDPWCRAPAAQGFPAPFAQRSCAPTKPNHGREPTRNRPCRSPAMHSLRSAMPGERRSWGAIRAAKLRSYKTESRPRAAPTSPRRRTRWCRCWRG